MNPRKRREIRRQAREKQEVVAPVPQQISEETNLMEFFEAAAVDLFGSETLVEVPVEIVSDTTTTEQVESFVDSVELVEEAKEEEVIETKKSKKSLKKKEK